MREVEALHLAGQAEGGARVVQGAQRGARRGAGAQPQAEAVRDHVARRLAQAVLDRQAGRAERRHAVDAARLPRGDGDRDRGAQRVAGQVQRRAVLAHELRVAQSTYAAKRPSVSPKPGCSGHSQPGGSPGTYTWAETVQPPRKMPGGGVAVGAGAGLAAGSGAAGRRSDCTPVIRRRGIGGWCAWQRAGECPSRDGVAPRRA